jgi:hypothetical protein
LRHAPLLHYRRNVRERPAAEHAERPAGSGPVHPPPRAPAIGRLERLQHAIGNRALGLLLAREAVDSATPAGIATGVGATPLPAERPRAADHVTTTPAADPSLSNYQWADRGRTTDSGTVGAMDRILLDGLRGTQQEQGPLTDATVPTGPGYANAVGQGPAGARGRAVAIVPRALRAAPTAEVAVVMHFHGIKSGSYDMRKRTGSPEDVADFQIPQQVEEFIARRPGARVIVILPIGRSIDGGRNPRTGNMTYSVSFDVGDFDAYIDDCLDKLNAHELPNHATRGPVYLSAHSGGGLFLSQMLRRGRLPTNFRGLFGFESWHGDTGTWLDYVADRPSARHSAQQTGLNADLAQLETINAAGGSRDEITRRQLDYLRDHGFRFVAFGGSGNYAAEARRLRQGILDWFADRTIQRRLRDATDGRHEVLDRLWTNYQANAFSGSTHTNALSHNSNFGRALDSLDASGPLAGTPAPAGASSTVTPAQPSLARRVRRLQRQTLDETHSTRITTTQGDFLRFSRVRNHTNSTNRPQFIHPASAMVPYTGEGSTGHGVTTAELIHPVLQDPLNRLMTALHAEGQRLNDESMKQAVVASGFRPSARSEGDAYLRALRKTIRLNPTELPNAFPAALEDQARSELGPVGSAAHNRFRDALAASSPWTRAQADWLIRETGRFKAPRGASTHHSGLTVDINFPYATSRRNVNWHGINRENNANAFRAGAGQWLNQHSTEFGFDTYSTDAEIWHMEWRDWSGTAADPAAPAPATSAAPPSPSAPEPAHAIGPAHPDPAPAVGVARLS